MAHDEGNHTARSTHAAITPSQNTCALFKHTNKVFRLVHELRRDKSNRKLCGVPHARFRTRRMKHYRSTHKRLLCRE